MPDDLNRPQPGSTGTPAPHPGVAVRSPWSSGPGDDLPPGHPRLLDQQRVTNPTTPVRR